MNAEPIKTTPSRVIRERADLAEFLAGGEDLHSQADVFLALTKDERRILLKVRLSTEGVREVWEEYARTSPRPPRRLKPLPRRETRGVEEFEEVADDPDFLERQRVHERKAGLAAVGRAVVGQITGPGGAVLTDPLARGKELERRGLTPAHFLQISEALKKMVSLDEADLDFLSAPASA